jgi:hypothetical protein
VTLARFLSRSLPAGSLWRWKGYDFGMPLIVVTTTLFPLDFDLEYIGFLFRI